MASGSQQPESFSIVDFEGRHAELVQKLSEISTSMRQCADIVDSFNQVVRHLALRPSPLELGLPRAPVLAPLRPPGYSGSERAGPPTPTAYGEPPGAPPSSQAPGVYRRPSYPGLGGPMHPPAVPAHYSATHASSHTPSASSIHTPSAPPSYPMQRTGSATSGSLHDLSGPGPRTTETVSGRASPFNPAKRKRLHGTDTAEPGDDSSDGATATGGSPQHEATEVAPEVESRSRYSVYGAEEGPEASRLMPKRQLGSEIGRLEDRSTDSTGGPSFSVFPTGAPRSRATSLYRPQGQISSSRLGKAKKTRDPNAPKQPPPAYIVYQNEVREAMRSKFPGLSPTELVKKIAATWKELTSEERQRYKDDANVQKDRWAAELAAYQAALLVTDESQPAQSSEGTFLAKEAVSDSPPASSPHQSPRMSDVEVESHEVRRVASHDAPSGSATYGYAYQAPLRPASSFPGPSHSRPSAESGPSYPPRPEHPSSRLASSTFLSHSRMSPPHMPSPPAGRTHFTGLRPDSRGPSNRLPSFDSLGLGHPTLPPVREPSPRPPRERSGDEPVTKRQRTRTNPASDEDDEGGGLTHSTYDERKSE